MKENPEDSDARGVILYGASISTSGWLGLGVDMYFDGEVTVEVRRRLGGINSGIPSAPARLSCVVVRPQPGA